jgi:hypothetical protein
MTNLVQSFFEKTGSDNTQGGGKTSEDSVKIPDNLDNENPREAYKKGVRDGLKKKREPEIKELRLEGVKEGLKEHIKNKVMAGEKIKDKLHELTDHEEFVLLQAKTFFPFDLFPDTLIIDTNKVAVTEKRFFATEHLTVINHKDIADVEVETSLFLANLIITYMPKVEGFLAPEQKKIKVKLLPRNDAVKAQHIVKGTLIARREDIDTTRLTPEEFKNVIFQLGESNVEI